MLKDLAAVNTEVLTWRSEDDLPKRHMLTRSVGQGMAHRSISERISDAEACTTHDRALRSSIPYGHRTPLGGCGRPERRLSGFESDGCAIFGNGVTRGSRRLILSDVSGACSVLSASESANTVSSFTASSRVRAALLNSRDCATADRRSMPANRSARRLATPHS